MGHPRRLAIIPDGNRRFARKNGLSLGQAYAEGFRKVTDVLTWIRPTDIQSTTLWALSLENFKKRSTLEVKLLFSLMESEMERTMEKMPGSFPKIRFIGRTDLLPKKVQDLMKTLEKKTGNRARVLNVAVAYSGKEELVRAATLAAESLKRGEIARIDDRAIEKNLYQPEPVDLLIRTGDVQRTSGFMPWQNAYAEVYFSKKLWPDFSRKDFQDALSFYENTHPPFRQ